MNKKRILIFLAAFIFLTQDVYLSADTKSSSQNNIRLVVGDVTLIAVYQPDKVAIRDPNIADIQKADENNITIVAKSKGTTILQYWDKLGEKNISIQVVPMDVKYIVGQIEKILYHINMPDIVVKPLPEEGRILLMGALKRNEDKLRIKTALGDLWNKVTDLITVDDSALVEIEVEILELDTDAQKTLGLTYPTSITLSEAGSPPISTILNKMMQAKLWHRSAAYSVKLDLLVQQGKAKILSRPKVVCQSGKDAELWVGGEVPNMKTDVVTGGGDAGSIEYKDYGIRLNIKPEVLAAGRIQLDLKLEVSEVGQPVYLGTATEPTAKAYPTIDRNISSKLYLSDGETLSIGGLLKKKEEEDVKKVPWLGDLPVVGSLFRNKDFKQGGGAGNREDKELFVTISPRIIYSSSNDLEMKQRFSKGDAYSEAKMTNYLQKEYKKSSSIPNELKDYIVQIQKKVLKNISYPALLLNTGWEGQVTVKLSINEDGSLKDAQIQKSSGYIIFDDETINLVKKLSYPPFPPDVYIKEVDISIPIIYQNKKK